MMASQEYSGLTVGILALQGDYERHEYQLGLLAVPARRVRLADHLDGLSALIIPGGESTTMSILLDRFALRDPIRRFAEERPVYGTCAGMILMASSIVENQAGVQPLGLMDIDVIRNGYGRQVHSFDTLVSLRLDAAPVEVPASFIRAPRVTRVGEGVEVLGRYGDDPVLVRQGRHLAAAFHAELDEDTRLLEYFLKILVAAGETDRHIYTGT